VGKLICSGCGKIVKPKKDRINGFKTTYCPKCGHVFKATYFKKSKK
jgi:DNA-directed RNA polymerase subunit M/transcription elongation factor TFIIS